MEKPKKTIKNDIRWEINGLLLISFGILGIFSIYTNAVGAVGNFLSKNFKGFSGQAAILLPLFIILSGIYCLYYKKKPNLSPRVGGLVIIFIVIVLLFHLTTHTNFSTMSFMERLRKSADLGVEGVGGGILGSRVIIISKYFWNTGSTILMVTFMIIGVILLLVNHSLI